MTATAPARSLPIWKIAVGALLLVGVGTWGFFGGKAYLARAHEQAAFAAVDAQKPMTLLQVRAADEGRLHAGPMPIDDAIKALGTRGRLGLGADLMPQPSGDLAPVMGWSNQPHDVPEWMMAPPPGADGGAASD